MKLQLIICHKKELFFAFFDKTRANTRGVRSLKISIRILIRIRIRSVKIRIRLRILKNSGNRIRLRILYWYYIEIIYIPGLYTDSSNFKIIGYHRKLNPDPDPERAKNHNPDPDPKQQPDYPVFKIRIRLRCTPLANTPQVSPVQTGLYRYDEWMA